MNRYQNSAKTPIMSYKYLFEITLKLWKISFGVAISFRTIWRHFGKSRIDYGHFNAKHLKNCRGTTGIIPSDLKFRHLICFHIFAKIMKIGPYGNINLDVSIWNL